MPENHKGARHNRRHIGRLAAPLGPKGQGRGQLALFAGGMKGNGRQLSPHLAKPLFVPVGLDGVRLMDDVMKLLVGFGVGALGLLDHPHLQQG